MAHAEDDAEAPAGERRVHPKRERSYAFVFQGEIRSSASAAKNACSPAVLKWY
jgi:hypothetical protein